ncbi:MAG: GAF domain-containing protein, partial [Candidatus Rokuibacteriota bacterium]
GRTVGAAAFLFDVTERRRREVFVRAMRAIGRSLTSSLDLNEALDTIVSRALEVMAADSALVLSWDGVGDELRVQRAAGRLSEHYAATGAIPVAGGPVSRAVREGKAVTTPNILSDARLWLTPERQAQIEREGFKAVAAAPLASKGRVHGALVVHYWAEREVSAEELTALTLLAEQAAIAIDNARLYADATRRADRLRELAEVERLVGASLDLDDVLLRIAEATARLVGAPAVHLWTAEPGAEVLRLRAASVDPSMPAVDMPATCAFGQGISGTAAKSRSPVFVPDAAGDARVQVTGWVHAGLRTVLSVPILSGETLLGVLTVRARSGALSADEDQALVTSLAARAAVAIQNARAYQEAVRRGARLRELAAVNQTITASLDAADVMQRIAAGAASFAPGAMAAVHVFEPAQGTLRFASYSHDDLRALPDQRAAEAGLPGLVFERREPVLVADPLAHARTIAREWWTRHPGASYYGVPIIAGDTFVGVLDYVAPPGLPPGAEDREALRLMAAYAGVAIRNASLFQTERAQAGRLGALAAINQRISSALDLDELLRMIAESAADLTGARYALFWLADEGTATLAVRSASASGLVEGLSPVLAYDMGGVGRVARDRTPVVVDDVFADPSIFDHAWWRRWGLRAFAGYPVMAGDRLLAVLALCHGEPIRFTDATRDMVGMFIAQASVAIQNARLYLEARRRRDVAEALARLSRELTASLDVEPIAELLARGMIELLRGNTAAVFRYVSEDGSLVAIRAAGHFAAFPGLALRAGEGVAGRAVADRRIVTTTDILGDPDIRLSPELRARLDGQRYGTVVAVPLISRDRVVGALGVGAERGRVFTADDLAVLQAFADQAALALENANLYAAARDSLARLRETQTQLVHAGKMSALGQLVSGVAHELNNPLSVIIGYGQLLLTRNIPEPLQRPVELMVQQGDRMAKIVRNLLYFARQRPPERAPVDINQVIEQTLALRLNQLTVSGITVERDFSATLPPVMADAQQLQQVFLNLLLNAEQAIAMLEEGGCIVFRTRVGGGGRTVLAEVDDNGPGIPSDVLPRVFEPFFTTKEVGSGTGLGLSVSYGIVEEHGGRLSVDSRPGTTTFAVALPVGTPIDGHAPPPPPPAPPVAVGHG